MAGSSTEWFDPGMALPSYLQPFVLPVVEADRRRHGTLDVYRLGESEGERRPVIVFIHGGPLPSDRRPTPRDWPVYVGYGSLAADYAVIGVTVDHRLHDPADYPTAAADVAAAIEQARALEYVDLDRVALWFFSGGGLLVADWLAKPPPWLRCIALTYPVMAPLPSWDVDHRFRPVDAVQAASGVPVLLTRVGRERADVAATVDAFLAAAQAHDTNLKLIDVPEGQHGFDMLDHTDSSRDAVRKAMAWVTETLRR